MSGYKFHRDLELVRRCIVVIILDLLGYSKAGFNFSSRVEKPSVISPPQSLSSFLL